MEKIKSEGRRVQQAREYDEPGFQWTRRAIALMSITAIVVVPILAGWISPSLSITHGWEYSGGGFLFFSDPIQTIRWGTGNGIILAPFHTHLVAAIAGMYFGSSSVK